MKCFIVTVLLLGSCSGQTARQVEVTYGTAEIPEGTDYFRIVNTTSASLSVLGTVVESGEKVSFFSFQPGERLVFFVRKYDDGVLVMDANKKDVRFFDLPNREYEIEWQAGRPEVPATVFTLQADGKPTLQLSVEPANDK